MKSLLVITAVDVRNTRLAPNQRVQHLPRVLRTYFNDVTVLYNSMAPFEHRLTALQRLGCLGQMERSAVYTEGGVRYVEVRTNLFRFWHSPFHSYSGPLITTLRFLLRDSKVYDVAVASTPWGGLVGLWLKRLGRVRFLVYEDHDLFAGFYPDNLEVYGCVCGLENRLVAEADLVICVSEELARLRRSYTKRPVHVVENGYQGECFRPASRRKSRSPTLVYAGALEEWAGVQLVIHALPLLVKQFKTLRYLVLGQGNYRRELEERAERQGVSRHMQFLGRRPYTELSSHYSEADIGICTFVPSQLTRYAFPLKIVEYMAMGLPVLGTDVGDIARVIRESGAGRVTSGGPQDVARQIGELLEPQTKAAAGSRAIEYASKYAWEVLLDREYKLIARCFPKGA